MVIQSLEELFFDEFQSGFMKMNLLTVIDNIFLCADKNAAVFIPDLLAAADTIDHIFLIESVKLIWTFLVCF